MRSFRVPGAWDDGEESDTNDPPAPISSVAKATLPTLQTVVAPAVELTSSPGPENDLSPREDQRPPLPIRPGKVRPAFPPSKPVQAHRSENRPPRRAPSKDDWQCDSCDKKGPSRYYCNICLYVYCSDCWNAQLPHKKLPDKPGQLPHEQTDLELERRIRRSLRPNQSAEENAELHRDDENATWFGLAPNHARNSESELGDSGRLEELISNYPSNVRSRLHPSLVSFIGQTGAGKSGLVNLLISLAEKNTDEDKPEDKPVVGSIGARPGPTSGDVHLYRDPKSVKTQEPMFYADCEGLQGGDSDPLSQKSTRPMETRSKSGHIQQVIAGPSTGFIGRFLKGRLRQLGLLGKKGRQYIVENLYSRVLYTFSDVIVFVLPAENQNTIENVTLQLLEWASKAIACSSNQPCLPHAVIVLNKSNPSLPEKEWDPISSTEWLFAGLERELESNLKFKPFVKELRANDCYRKVGAKELLECYYSSVLVVRVPAFADGAGRPNLIKQQMEILYKRLSDCCYDARNEKQQRRMLLTADQLSPYIQLAFDHFSVEGLDKGFDFIQASFLTRPVFPNLADNIFAIAKPSLVIRKTEFDQKRLKAYFADLSRPVASALMFDAARNERMGTAKDIFPQYREACENALGKIMSKLWPCATQNCSNVRDGHMKGHQMSNGRVIGAREPYSPTLGFSEQEQRPEFLRLICENLDTMLGQVSAKSSTKEEKLDLDAGELFEARRHHRRVMSGFLEKEAGPVTVHLNFRDNIGCLLCLFGLATHTLPCGHTICGECVRSYGNQRSSSFFEMPNCPLHVHEDWQQPMSIRYKPDLAGVRVLSIDGGGIRGIIQLAVLQDLEREFRGDIPIQCFFDLAVGTSIGGIIALGLFARGWSVKTSIDKFESLCKRAFTRRWFADALAWFRLFYHRYQTVPLEDALREEFGDRCLFGDAGIAADGTPFDTKIAITAASPSAGTYVLANYNRLQQGTHQGHLLRASFPDNEFKIWEVARSTSAAPTWFEQYVHKASGRVLLDGGIYHNNPILIANDERASVWPGAPLDFVVSLGTGLVPTDSVTTDMDSTMESGSQLRNLGKVAFHKLMSSLDAEKTWNEHVSTLTSKNKERHVRLNTPLVDPLPELDAVDQIASLEELTHHFWTGAQEKGRIRNLARRMVASSFYFEMGQTGSGSLSSGKATGFIQCRLDSSKHKYLGEYFSRQAEVSHGTRPEFNIKNSSSGRGVNATTINIVDTMFTQQSFWATGIPVTIETNDTSSLTEITLVFGQGLDAQYPISGFPRCLF